MAERDGRTAEVADPEPQTQPGTTTPPSAYAQARPSAYAQVQASAYARVQPPSAYAAARPSAYAQTHTAPPTVKPAPPVESAYRLLRRRRSAYPRPRRRTNLVVVIPPPRTPTGLWAMNYRNFLLADPETDVDEYEEQISVHDPWVDFDDANARFEMYLQRCNNGPGEVKRIRPACIAEVVGDVAAALHEDPNMHTVLKQESWDRIWPQLLSLRDRLAVDPEWLMDNYAGEITQQALEWATEMGEQYKFTGQQLRRLGREALADQSFVSALLDTTVFNFLMLFEEGHQAFQQMSQVRSDVTQGYFPCAPQQVLVFEVFGGRDQQLQGAVGLAGAYRVEKSEYISNLATFRGSPRFGTVGWRVHHMVPGRGEAHGEN